MSGAQARAAAEGLAAMQGELRVALSRLSSQDLVAWSGFVLRETGSAASRRVANVGSLLLDVGSGASSIAVELARVARKDGASSAVGHAKALAGAGAAKAGAKLKSASAAARELARNLRSNPSQAIPQLMTTTLVALLVSGGPDGDGGVPDLDLMVGIGAHRSWWSHSILAGAALEGLLRAVLELVRIVHDKLPAEREPLWDVLYLRAAEVTEAANKGVSLGIGYHLGVDGTVQPAAYHGLALEMPMGAHQTLFTANSVAELNDVRNKPRLVPERSSAAEAAADIGAPRTTSPQPEVPASPALPLPPPKASGASSSVAVVAPAPSQPRWRDTATPEARASMQLSHKEHRQRPFRLVDRARAQFTSDEQEQLRRYGTWLRGLANGDLEPLTPEQDSFVSAVESRSASESHNVLFALWGRYQRAHAQNAPLGSRPL